MQPGSRLPFADTTLDAVTFCPVLFLVPQPEALLQVVWRVLRPTGRVVILTPSGSRHLTPALLRGIGASPHNWTFLLWRCMTASSGRTWARGDVLGEFAQRHAGAYSRQPVFGGFATLETIEREPVWSIAESPGEPA